MPGSVLRDGQAPSPRREREQPSTKRPVVRLPGVPPRPPITSRGWVRHRFPGASRTHAISVTARGVIRPRTPRPPTPALPSSGASRSRRRLPCSARKARSTPASAQRPKLGDPLLARSRRLQASEQQPSRRRSRSRYRTIWAARQPRAAPPLWSESGGRGGVSDLGGGEQLTAEASAASTSGSPSAS